MLLSNGFVPYPGCGVQQTSPRLYPKLVPALLARPIGRNLPTKVPAQCFNKEQCAAACQCCFAIATK